MLLSHRAIRLRGATLVALFALAAVLSALVPRPALADGAASTRNIILGAAAIAAGVIIYNNVQHKRMAHDTVVGRTRDGGLVYADGRVVYPNGNVLYTSNGDGRVCNWYDSYNRCSGTPVVYRPAGRGDVDRGNHYGWYKHHGHHHGDEGDQGDGEHGNHGDGE